MYNKFLTGILVALITAILGILGYLGYGIVKKITLNAGADEFLEEFDSLVVPIVSNDEDENNNEGNNENNTSGTNNNKNNSGSGNVNYGLTYKGFKVLGKIEIPAINIRYPILEGGSAKAIEVAVVMTYGVGVNNPGNTVIAGHNYNNGLFFGKNKKLRVGDKVYLTDLNGVRKEYTIYEKYTTSENDTAYYTTTTNGRPEVTLYTCDATGKNRLVIKAYTE